MGGETTMSSCCNYAYRVDPDCVKYAMSKAGYKYGKGGGVSRLARDSGIARSTLDIILKGGVSSPGVSVMVQIADTLGVDVHDLLVENDRCGAEVVDA